MTALAMLAAHFDACADRGTPRNVWWRDDDARRPGPRLAALQAIAAAAAAPLALAVIPEGLDPALLAWCEAQGVAVLQHGIGHHNHQRAGKSAELGDARPADTVLADLLAARESLLCPAFVPVLVPPWNRMREDLDEALAGAGYVGVSRFGAAPQPGPPPRIDTHIDPVAWRTTRSLLPEAELADMTARAIDLGGPIGLLTHHIDHDPALSAFVAAFAGLVGRHPGARWVGAREISEALAMSNPFTPIEDLAGLRGALFGLDFGTRTIGIAVSDEGWRIGSPLETIRRKKFTQDAAYLLALATRYNVVAFVVGMPFNMDGSAGPRVQSTRDFARNLKKLDDRAIVSWDERWSTVAANRAMLEADASRAKRRESVDKVAAAIILQGALDRLRALGLPGETRPPRPDTDPAEPTA